MKWKNKLLIPMLALWLILAGCFGANTPIQPKSEADCSPAQGRYVEKEISVEPIKSAAPAYYPMALFVRGDGSLDCLMYQSVTSEEMCLKRFHTADGGDTWEMLDTSWFDTLSGSYDLSHCPNGDMDPDGNLYFIFEEKEPADSQIWIALRVSPAGEATKLFEVNPETSGLWLLPRMIRWLPDGNLALMTEFTEIVVFDQAGQEVYGTMLDDYMQFDTPCTPLFREQCFMSPERDSLEEGFQLVTRNYEGKKLSDGPSLLNEREDGEYIEHYGCVMRLFDGGDGSFFMVDKRGVSRSFGGASYWETLMDASQYQFGRVDRYLCAAAFEPSTRSFYMMLEEKDGSAPAFFLYRYDFDETAPTQPANTLTVFAMDETKTLLQAVTSFQNTYPGCKVELRLPPPGMTKSQVERILKMELSDGEGPDVLLLDGLSWEPWRDSFADLSGLLKQGDYFTNLVCAYQMGERVDAVPARVMVPLMVGDAALLERLGSLPDLVAAARENAGARPPLLEGVRRFYEPVRMFYGLYAPSLRGPQSKESLTELLSATKELCEYYRRGVADADLESLARPLQENRIVAFGPDLYFQGRAQIGFQNCGRFGLFREWTSSPAKPEQTAISMDSLLGSGVFYPNHIAAVNAEGPQREQAEQFVQVLLSGEVQALDPADKNGEGFPVERTSFRQRMEMDNVSFQKDPVALMESLDTPACVDEAGLFAVLRELPAYYSEKETLEEAVEHILAAQK